MHVVLTQVKGKDAAPELILQLAVRRARSQDEVGPPLTPSLLPRRAAVDAEGGQTLGGSFEGLYRSEILQENVRLKALAEIYKMHSFAQL